MFLEAEYEPIFSEISEFLIITEHLSKLGGIDWNIKVYVNNESKISVNVIFNTY